MTSDIRLTSHSGGADAPKSIGVQNSRRARTCRGTTITRRHRNVIGTHSGSYSVPGAGGGGRGAVPRPSRRPDQHSPTDHIGPYPQGATRRRS